MCGFVAVFLPGRAPVDAALLDRMTDCIAHRGPDGRGVHLEPGVGLGHRRLAIIDLEGGAQPLSGPDDRTWIVFNGEAYNYQDVRAGLPGPWKTRSDTEVFLRAYEVRGLRGLDDIVGMFGAAIWDAEKRQLVVIRDRLGVKPVYHAELAGGGHAFASELRALLEHPGVDRGVDLVALDQLLTYRFVPGPRTLLKGVKKLLPGRAAIATDEGLRIERWWAPKPRPEPWTDGEAEAAFIAAFDRSVALRMVSDVPVGVFLSGGIDSAAVLQAMHKDGVDAFTVAFEGGEGDDEIPFARETARLFNARHHTLVIGPKDYAGYLDAYARQLEEPVLNDSAIAIHFLSKLARERVKVVLTGQGADEPLAGYDRYKGELLARYYRRLPVPAAFERLVLDAPIPEKAKRAVKSLKEPDALARALRIYAVFQDEEKERLLRPEVRAAHDAELLADPIARNHREAAELSSLGRMLYTDTRVWLPDDLLLVADKLSMAHGLELRVPFLDHRLIELLERMPDDQKLRLGRRGFVTKRVHRAAMAKRLPRAILERKKRGFTNPLDVWLRRELAPLVVERLLADRAPVLAYVERAEVERLFRAHTSGRQDHRRALFLLLTLDAWLRAFSPGP